MDFKAWEKLSSIKEGDSIQLRGYLYQTQDGRWLLNKNPNLKSCCIGAAHTLDQQIFLPVEDIHLKPHLPVKVEGIFHHNAQYNDAKILIERFSLSDVSITPLQKSHAFSLFLGVLMIFLFAKRALRRRCPPPP